MKVMVEFTNPVTQKFEIISMEGPESTIEDVRRMFIDTLESLIGYSLPEDFDLNIYEVASGTIH